LAIDAGAMSDRVAALKGSGQAFNAREIALAEFCRSNFFRALGTAEHDDLMTFNGKPLREMTANESSSTCDSDFHLYSSMFAFLTKRRLPVGVVTAGRMPIISTMVTTATTATPKPSCKRGARATTHVEKNADNTMLITKRATTPMRLMPSEHKPIMKPLMAPTIPPKPVSARKIAPGISES